MKAISINHVSVHADDLAISVDFYERVLGLERIATPVFAFPVQWMRVGDQQLHLFVREDTPAPAFHHIGFNVDDFEALWHAAKREGLTDTSAFFSSMYELPDGSVQMYIRDPAGNLLEIDCPNVDALSAGLREHLVLLSDTVEQTRESLRATLYLRPSGNGVPVGSGGEAHAT